MRNLKTLLVAFAALAMVAGATERAHAAPILLTPTTVGVFGASLDASNCGQGCVETAFGLPAGSLAGDLLYKDNVGGSEEGSYTGSYSTSFFNSPGDPQDATISWTPATPIISCPDCYLVIKGGGPTQGANAVSTLRYFYNLGVAQGTNGIWDGVSPIIMTGFWPAQGAISNVAIWGAPSAPPPPPPVPEPASLLLFAGGIGAAAFKARRRRLAPR